MKVVFFGTPEFAVESLRILLENGVDIAAVVTASDKPSGRGQQIHYSPVKEFALQNGLKILQPERLRDASFLDELHSIRADLFVVVAFRMLPEVVWQMPPLGTINLHASLLPQYRGAAPINWAIINGETQTGVTTFFIEKEIDTGKIIFQEKAEILPQDNAGSLHDKLMNIGARLLLKTVRALQEGGVSPVPQNKLFTNENELKLAPKLNRETCRIKSGLTVLQTHNLVRGLSPYPAAFIEFMDDKNKLQQIKIFESQPEFGPVRDGLVGKIISDNKHYLKLVCTDGFLSFKQLQLSGKKRMSVEEFLRGFKLPSVVQIK